MVKKLLLSMAVFAVAASVLALGSNAVFTSTASNDANTFTVGTVVIGTSPATAFITYSGMAPGDKVTSPLTVSNTGTLQLRYAVTSTTTENTLAAQLDLTIKSGVTTCTNGGFDTDGTALYGAADLGSIAGIDAIGDPAQGSQAGDRTLNASASEVLCFQASLPLATGDSFQGLTSTATFAFQAEQTANNP